MAAKVYRYEPSQANPGPAVQYWFHCPGCGNDHAFTVEGEKHWKFNGNMEAPTFKPSLLCNRSEPGSRCHSLVTDGKIEFLNDSWHKLKGQTVDLPDWE